MFKADRIYSTQNQSTGATEWFIQCREGELGPYQSRRQAEYNLESFKTTCIKLSGNGFGPRETKLH